jgi:signal transduction histidine kinase/ActR/RegA family two-component response regulator
MVSFPKRWQSIDRKLPILASGLVVLTAVVLATTAYALLQRALMDAAGKKLLSTAAVIAQMTIRPTMRVDSASLAAEETLRSFALGKASSAAAVEALSRQRALRDTARVYAALTDVTGRTLVAYRRDAGSATPRWPFAAIAEGDIDGDSLSLGMVESVTGKPAYSTVQPLRVRGPGSELIGYVVELRELGGGRTLSQFRDVAGTGVNMAIGDVRAGEWTDLEHIVTRPVYPMPGGRADTIVTFADGVGAYTRIANTNWMVWVSQSRADVLAPANMLLWSMIPFGLAIALVGAAITFRMTSRITHPIVELTSAAENIAADNGSGPMLPTVFLAPGADEIARLRYAFERMARRVSERQTLEMQLRQSQKMEAIGQLAGGVAHDFNNLLTAIRSYADLMLQDMPVWDTKRSDVLEIRSAAQRAAALTAQLLAFSRKQMLQPRILQTATVLTELRAMLQRLLTEDIELRVEPSEGVWSVKADRGQLEQVIVNLVVNARDAMPDGGLVYLAAANAHLEEPFATRHNTVPPGDYVAIRVKDSGVGMNLATQQRAFEPFFTTKPVGQGTGLGLATVHGIVAQSGGYVTLESAPQQGTTFTVWLPRSGGDEVVATEPAAAVLEQRGHNETILLVEDEQAVRVLARRVLMRAGFRVLESSSPNDAIRLAEMHGRDIKLVLSDVVMPEMSGPQLVARITGLCPDARVLYMSGYTDDEVIGRGLANPGIMLLQKPFSAQELVERVRVALDQKAEVSV